jgi:hypothetical protein
MIVIYYYNGSFKMQCTQWSEVTILGKVKAYAVRGVILHVYCAGYSIFIVNYDGNQFKVQAIVPYVLCVELFHSQLVYIAN